jgi:hypothetical protein
MKFLLSLLLSALLLSSCATEKVNLSPISANFSNNSSRLSADTFENTGNNVEFIKYSSDLTNICSTFPKFGNQDVNKEISRLKFNISEYIFAVKEHNKVGKEKAFYNYEKSYKKIQRLRSELNKDEQILLNRFMVNIKTNITLLESLKSTP